MANQLYTNAIVAIDGATATQETSVSIDRSSGSSAVITVARGYAGESPGAAMTEISVDNAAPALGFEFDAGPKMLGLAPVEISVRAAGKTLTCKGFIVSDSFSHAANSESKVSFKFRGGPSKWT